MLAYSIVRLIFWTLELAPSARLARFYLTLLDKAVPKLRRAALFNLERIAGLPDANRIVDRLYDSNARSMALFAQFPKIGRHNIADYIRYEGFEHYAAAKQAGKGVLFATAHMGNWELSAFAHGWLTEPMNVVVRPLDNPYIDEFVERRRALSGNRIIAKKDAAREILKALKRNEPVGILIDQNAGLDDGVFIDFFGTKACAGSAFARLAAHSGAAVIPGFALWSSEEQRYILRFYPPVPMTGDAAADTERIHSVFEQVIREYPDQWLWFHRRWKTRPPGEPPLY